jgi:NAD(P)-dependent dehydrogenase (short-subunit alcohol dehydrogenase family)
MDGAFGMSGPCESSDPAIGGMAGLIKTAAHEWAEVACKVIDLSPEFDDVEALVDELLRRGPIEVGLTREARRGIALRPAALQRASVTTAFDEKDVVLITGGARGVTAEVAVALAEAFRPTLVLLGRSPAPHVEPEWLAPLSSEAEIKRALAARANGQATPQGVAQQFRATAANREIQRTLLRIEAAAARAIYRAVDVRDERALRRVLAEARNEFGPIRGLIHGAGVLADRRIESQRDDEFTDVYSTKVGGFRALLRALESDDLRSIVVFSSSTARFGRTGQVAYAAANEALNKLAQREARRRPSCRVVAVNWGPWDGGMVTPALKPLFASEGIGLIPMRAGARHLIHEITDTQRDRPVEVVVMGEGSIPATVGTADHVAVSTRGIQPDPTETRAMTRVFERALDLDSLPVLNSHVIDGRAVVPMALLTEWLVQGALQRNPGLVLRGFDDARVLKGAILDEERREVLSVHVGKTVRDGGEFRVPAEVRGTLDDGRTLVHVRAEVVLSEAPLPGAIATIGFAAAAPSTLTPRGVYQSVLFHGPALQGLDAIEALGPTCAVATARTSPPPSTWLERPLRQNWLTDPLALDSAFQLLSLWCFDQTGAVSLPTRVGRCRQFGGSHPSPLIRIAARIERPSEHRATAEIDFVDLDGALVARIEDYECVIDRSLNQAFRRNRLLEAARSPI